MNILNIVLTSVSVLFIVLLILFVIFLIWKSKSSIVTYKIKNLQNCIKQPDGGSTCTFITYDQNVIGMFLEDGVDPKTKIDTMYDENVLNSSRIGLTYQGENILKYLWLFFLFVLFCAIGICVWIKLGKNSVSSGGRYNRRRY